MGIDVLRSTTVGKVQYDETNRQYSVELENENGKQLIKPKHIVLATGLFSSLPNRPEIPGEGSFQGMVYHSSEHQSAAHIPDLKNKKVVMVGCGTSAHDIAQDFVNQGAQSVSMVQRHPIFVMSLDSVEKFQFPLWNTPGVSLNDADLLGNSFSIPLVRSMGIGMSQMMAANDSKMLDGLEKAGMALLKGESCGLLDHALVKGGHFYVDQGASQMVIDGRIKILRCEQGVTSFSSEGVVLGNGTTVEADVVILATGFQRGDLAVEQIMGKEVKDRVGNIGFMNDEQERIGVSVYIRSSEDENSTDLVQVVETDWHARILVPHRKLLVESTIRSVRPSPDQRD
jgi:cation diffusion facilitator CzcD-associated flavoprotein CzcO